MFFFFCHFVRNLFFQILIITVMNIIQQATQGINRIMEIFIEPVPLLCLIHTSHPSLQLLPTSYNFGSFVCNPGEKFLSLVFKEKIFKSCFHRPAKVNQIPLGVEVRRSEDWRGLTLWDEDDGGLVTRLVGASDVGHHVSAHMTVWPARFTGDNQGQT